MTKPELLTKLGEHYVGVRVFNGNTYIKLTFGRITKTFQMSDIMRQSEEELRATALSLVKQFNLRRKIPNMAHQLVKGTISLPETYIQVGIEINSVSIDYVWATMPVPAPVVKKPSRRRTQPVQPAVQTQQPEAVH